MSTLVKFAIPVAAALAIAAGIASAQQQPQQPPPQSGYGPGYGMGPGMMGGYGPGAGAGPRGGYGPGYGPGYHGMGPGGGYGMGPGMMGGYGDGMGMGGYGDGMGPWMMGGLALRALGLTAAQEAQVNKISDELRRKNWDLLGKMQDEGAKLRDLYGSDKLDRSAITAAYKRLGDLRQARIENALEAQEKIEAVLTPDQRKELRSRGYGWRGQ